MNWKASLTAALIVAAAGAGTGFAFRAKSSTRVHTDTVTVASTVIKTVSAPTPAAVTTHTSAAKASTGKAAGAGGTSNGNQQYYADYLTSQDTGQLDSNATNVSLDSGASTLQLNGQTYPHAVAFDLSNSDPNNSGNSGAPSTESYQLPVPGFKHFSASVAGLATNASAKATYKLTIYKNNDNPGAPMLYSGTFSGPSGVHAISFDTQGATDIVLDWSEPPNGEPDRSDQFILADPVVTH